MKVFQVSGNAFVCAQLLHELEQGERCWFSKEEEEEIQRNNRRFYAQSPMEEVLRGTTCTQLSRLLPAIGRKVHTRYGNGYWVKRV